ncbi:MAG: alpha/beta hydrolase [Alphaproteobacteria bacterium]|nr:MAG: alpha/beta hydrolase [Alphaproteobacteria bacterium]
MEVNVAREPSEEFKVIESLIREAMKLGPDFGTRKGVELARAVFNQPVEVPEGPVKVIPCEVAGRPAEWIAREDADPAKRILNIHGGGFTACGLNSHRAHAMRLADISGAHVLTVDYRLAPEHPFPAGLEDCEAAYDWLRENTLEGANRADRVFVMGDSAGGNLTAALALKLKDQGKTLPDGLILMSPVMDLSYSSKSWEENEKSDILIGPMARGFGQHDLPDEEKFQQSLYLQGQDGHQPYASPLNGDLVGFPPFICVASDVEVLRDDSIHFVEKARAAGVDVEFQLWPYVYHVWPVAGEASPEARQAIDAFKVFIDRICAA